MPPAKKPATATDTASDPATDPATGPQGGRATSSDVAEGLDAINLEQALTDFAVANARVLDLTRRLCQLNDEVVARRDENVRLNIELDRLRRGEARLEALERSRAVQLANGALRVAGLARRFVPSGR